MVIVLKICFLGLFPSALLYKSILFFRKTVRCFTARMVTVRLFLISRKAVFLLELPRLSAFFPLRLCFLPFCFPCAALKTIPAIEKTFLFRLILPLLDIVSRSFRLFRLLDIMSRSYIPIPRLVCAGLLLLCLLGIDIPSLGTDARKSIFILCKFHRLIFLLFCH